MFRVLIILILFPWLSWADSRLLEFELNGKKYYLMMLESGGTESAYLREIVYKKAENFMLDEYIARGTLDPVRDKDMIQALRTTETINDGRSNLLVVFEREDGRALQTIEDLGTPRAMIRVAHQTDEKMLLPFEERLAPRGFIKVKETNIEKAKKVELPLDLIFVDGKILPLKRSVIGSTGGKLEMKNFVVSKATKESWFPTIMQMVEWSGWTSIGDPHHISDIYLETGEGPLLRYYKALGFEVVDLIEKDPDISTKSTVIMRISREKFRELAENAAKRDSKLLDMARFKHVRGGWQGLRYRPRIPFVDCPSGFAQF